MSEPAKPANRERLVKNVKKEEIDVPLKVKRIPSNGTKKSKTKDGGGKKKENEVKLNAKVKKEESPKKASVVSQTLGSVGLKQVAVKMEANSTEAKAKVLSKKASFKSETIDKSTRTSRGAADKARKRMSSQSNESEDSHRGKQHENAGVGAQADSDSAYSDDDEWYESKTQNMKQLPGEKKLEASKESSRSLTRKMSGKVEKSKGDDAALVLKKKTKVVDKTKLKKEKVDADDLPLIVKRKKGASDGKARLSAKRALESDSEEEKKAKTPAKKPKMAKMTDAKKGTKRKSDGTGVSPKKKVKEEPEIWKWWEEDRSKDGVKWRTLAHKGPYFALPYESLPDKVKLLYEGKPMKLSPEAEEAAGFYARMLDHEYICKPTFRQNFWADWRKAMQPDERKKIVDLEKCDFSKLSEYFVQKSEERKAMSKEEKKKIKETNDALQEEYGFCMIDGHRQKIGNWKIEPPGLFRGRGEHPKMGKLKKRIRPKDVTINIGKEAELPHPPTGQWGEVKHDNKVTWLATWIDTINGERKYVLLNAASHLKGEKDWQKYETARSLKGNVGRIREQYTRDWKSKLMEGRQRGVAVYFIDKLALRAGNEKDTDEAADTVGCCSLRVEHIRLHDSWDGKEFVVEFDFLGKDSIRYVNHVPVERQVFKNLKRFMSEKDPDDDLFDRITTMSLNKHLQSVMPGLTAKVFRTFNASFTLQEQLQVLTQDSDTVEQKLLSYNRANRQVAILCNHQRSIPKTFDKQMERLVDKIKEKEEKIAEAKKELKSLTKSNDTGGAEKKKKAIERLKTQLHKLDVQQTDKEENKTVALGTSKLNYLDPRISVAWCKKFKVPLEKVYNKTQREKFAWAIHMVDETFEF
eukprot:m.13620 g.13620  ORF g.13620 m.13620 type:complete len:863 (+) comp25108_c0_seq1:70-2658(+)